MRILTVLLLGACSKDEPEASSDTTEPVPVVVIPTLAVSSPERGSFVDAGSVKLAGSAGQGSAALDGLTLNGATAISLGSDGAFSAPIGLSPGINIFGLRLEDAGGERAVDGRAVYAGPLGDYAAHAPLQCSTGGATAIDVTPPGASAINTKPAQTGPGKFSAMPSPSARAVATRP